MNTTGHAPRTIKRWSSAAVVIGSTVAVLASPLTLGAASALAPDHPASAVAIASGSQNQNLAIGGLATLNVTYTTSDVFHTGDTAPKIYLTFTNASGPDYAQASFPHGLPCATTDPADGTKAGTATCTFTNNGTGGVDTVEVFADNSDTNHDATDPGNVFSAQTNVTFSGGISSLQISPTSSSSSTGSCFLYTVTAKDANGVAAGHRTVWVTVTEPAVTSPTFTHYDGNCVSQGAGGTFTVQTGADGTVTFGVSANKAGSGTVRVDNAAATPTASASASASWNGVDNGGPNNVTNLSVDPPTTSDYVFQTETFTLTATDAAGQPVQNVTVSGESLSGPDTAAPVCALPTKANGTTTCTVTNGGTQGPDVVRFWVNYTAPAPAACAAISGGFDAACEPSTTATATFNNLPPAGTTVTLTCPDQTDSGAASDSCVQPAGQKTVDFTATVKTGGSPAAGVAVTFTTSGTGTGTNPPTTTPLTQVVTTGANGVATFTVTNNTAANGNSVTVTATIGNLAHGGFGPDTATATWESRIASELSVTPVAQSVTKGGTVSVTAKVVDQFGTGVSGVNHLTYFVSGRNTINNTNIDTDATGTAQITYNDTGSANLPDTIQVHDNTPPLNGQPNVQAQVIFINGANTAAAVTIDTSGLATTDATCTPGAANHPAATNVALVAPPTSGTPICAIVKNSGGELLAGKSVTFTVSSGVVDSLAAGTKSTSTTTYVTTTDAKGVAFARVSSTKSGVQTVTATAESVTASGTVTYAAPSLAQARNVAITPSPATIDSGAQQKFTITVTDVFGNGIPHIGVSVTQSGPGSLNGQSSLSLTTFDDGTASATLTTAAGDTGSGSVAASIPNTGNQCTQPASGSTPAGNCSATATYTVKKAAEPTSLSLQAVGPHKVGSQELVAATVTNEDGTPAANQVVRFKVSGANSASGSGVTNAKGVAFFSYTPSHAGKDHLTAYADVDINGSAGAAEPKGSTNVTIGSGKKEHPRLRLTSKNGTVTLHVTSRPKLSHAKVTYYIEKLGRFHSIGHNRTKSNGHAKLTVHKKPGIQHTYRVKVKGKHGVLSGKSKPKSIRTQA